eukprot:3641636-Alexandrium_andersonii.AAC.1
MPAWGYTRTLKQGPIGHAAQPFLLQQMGTRAVASVEGLGHRASAAACRALPAKPPELPQGLPRATTQD